MTIAVIGAGIAGLSVAACLAREGIACTVYEQDAAFDEPGAGIQISPNGSRLLHRLGLGPRLDAAGVRPAAIELRRWDSDVLVARTELGEACERRFGAPYLTLRRADLHRALLDLVGGSVRMAGRCVGVGPDGSAVRVRFADGTHVTADLVIGADGIHSVVRRCLAAEPPRWSGIDVYRGLVPAPRRPALAAVRIWLGPGQHCVSYPVPGWVSFVAVAPARGWGEGSIRSWQGPGDRDELLTAYRGWHPSVRAMLAAANSLTRWSLLEGPPLPRWSAGRVTLVGDAAHAMLPIGAQGASQAIEDAAALAGCLRTAELPAALARYEAIRTPRIAELAASVRTNAREHHLPDGPAQRARDEALASRHTLAGQSWLYGYDAELAAQP